MLRCAALEAALLGAALCLVAMASADAQVPGAAALRYPPARRSDHLDVYHGVRVPDPYRWMEDIDAPETRAWVEAQDRLSRGFLDAIPGRSAMTHQLRQIWNL